MLDKRAVYGQQVRAFCLANRKQQSVEWISHWRNWIDGSKRVNSGNWQYRYAKFFDDVRQRTQRRLQRQFTQTKLDCDLPQACDACEDRVLWISSTRRDFGTASIDALVAHRKQHVSVC